MIDSGRVTAARGLLAALAVQFLAGCGSKTIEQYKPPTSRAEQAITSALTAWRDGTPTDKLVAEGITVHFEDSDFKASKKLLKFTIQGEAPSTEAGQAATQLKAQLTFQGVIQAQEVTYVVVGQDPLWVWRDTDYQKLSGM